mmetsp:Transcript_31691/g.74200  ORF Transcript_31691/g.74200 Transcript_31691/m.74200 type:complete len:212 (-) Transcript_31691:489-1124(-)
MSKPLNPTTAERVAATWARLKPRRITRISCNDKNCTNKNSRPARNRPPGVALVVAQRKSRTIPDPPCRPLCCICKPRSKKKRAKMPPRSNNNNNNTTPMRPILLRTITSLRHHIIMPLRRLLLTMPIHRLNMEHHRHILTGNMLCHRHPEIDRAMLSKRIHLRTPEDCWKWTSEPRRKYRRSGIGNRRNTNCPYPASSPSNRIINGLRKTQ